MDFGQILSVSGLQLRPSCILGWHFKHSPQQIQVLGIQGIVEDVSIAGEILTAWYAGRRVVAAYNARVMENWSAFAERRIPERRFECHF